MIPVTIEVKGERQLLAHLGALPLEVQQRLLPVINSITRDLLYGVRSAEPFKTGALRASTRMFVDTGPTFIRGRVRVLASPTGAVRAAMGGRLQTHNVAAAALEYGVHSSFPVRAHAMRISHIFNRPGARLVMVRAYTRRVSMRARRFMRDPFERIRPLAEAEIKRALEQVKL